MQMQEKNNQKKNISKIKEISFHFKMKNKMDNKDREDLNSNNRMVKMKPNLMEIKKIIGARLENLIIQQKKNKKLKKEKIPSASLQLTKTKEGRAF